MAAMKKCWAMWHQSESAEGSPLLLPRRFQVDVKKMPSTPINDITLNTACRFRLFFPPNLRAVKKLTAATTTNEIPAVTNIETTGATACVMLVAIGPLL